MMGGTLMISRAVKLHGHYQKRLEALGFKDVALTAADRDALVMKINEKKPRLILFSAGYYYSATAYMMSRLVRQFSSTTFVSITIGEYPASLAAGFIAGGVKSYIDYWDGENQFYRGLDRVREGKSFISDSVQERIATRGGLPDTNGKLTRRELEIVRLLCNGFKTSEIGDVLHISEQTVYNHKAAIYPKLNVESVNEIIRMALVSKIVTLEELMFSAKSGKKLGMRNEQ